MLIIRNYLTAQEIAALALDGLPETKRGVQVAAERAGWSWVDQSCRGGTARAFSVADFPERARRDLNDRWAARAPLAKRGRPKGSDFFTRNPDIAAAVEALLAERSLAAARIGELLSTRFDNVPPRRTLARFMARLEKEKPALLASTRDPDLFKSKYRISIGRADAAVTDAHQVWEIDTTKADVHCVEGRKSILGIVDVWTRRVFYLVVDSESAQSVRRTLAAAITAWGVMPEILRTDRGSGYINETIRTAVPMLGIEHDAVPPASGDKKPFVERMFGTFTRERAELLDGYAGHDVEEASKLRQRARHATGRPVIVPTMTAAQLQDVINNWLDGVYHVRRHSGTGATPMARWTNSPRPARLAADEGALKLALSASVGTATVGKRGVQWKNGRYWTAPLAAYVGRQVHLRRDEGDLGELYVFDEDGRYLGTAINHERSGLSQEAYAAAARRDQATWMKDQRKELRSKQRDFRFEDARDALLRRDAEEAGKLITLPVAAIAHPTTMLDSIADAPAALPSAHSLDRASSPRRKIAPHLAVTSVDDRVAQADAVLAAHAAGEVVDPAALRSAELYAGSSEYRAVKILDGPRRAQRAPDLPASFHRTHKENQA